MVDARPILASQDSVLPSYDTLRAQNAKGSTKILGRLRPYPACCNSVHSPKECMPAPQRTAVHVLWESPHPQTQERPPRAEEQSGGTPERRHRQEAQSAQGRMRWPDESGIWNGGRRKPQSSRAGRGAEGREIQKYCCGDLRKTGRTSFRHS